MIINAKILCKNSAMEESIDYKQRSAKKFLKKSLASVKVHMSLSFLLKLFCYWSKKFVSQELISGSGIVIGDGDTLLWLQNDDPFAYCMRQTLQCAKSLAGPGIGKNKSKGPCILQNRVHVIPCLNVKENFHYYWNTCLASSVCYIKKYLKKKC